jgi:hypothetical protein
VTDAERAWLEAHFTMIRSKVELVLDHFNTMRIDARITALELRVDRLVSQLRTTSEAS